MKNKTMIALAALGLMTASCRQNMADEKLAATLTAVQDRLAVEDLLLQYYTHLGSGSHKGFGDFFTDDAVLDINGIILKGKTEIQGIYDRSSHEPAANVPMERTHMDYMHLTNPLIRVNGDRATAKMFWTGVVSDDLNAPPVFEEMGREYDLLVKADGKWKIKKRVIIADAGMPRSMNKTYKRRPDYDITKDD